MGGEPMDSFRSSLTQLQTDVLQEFFAREQRFVLTGRGALAGFHLGHRASQDLDLFARTPLDLDEGESVLRHAASAIGATAVSQRRFPHFRRWLLQRGDESTLVDLVLDLAPQVEREPMRRGTILVDSPREIIAGKLCALLGRGEIRDLVDLRALLLAGADLDQALADAASKDGGVDAATLAWLLDQLRIGPEAGIPGGVSALELEEFRIALVRDLRRRALPRNAQTDP